VSQASALSGSQLLQRTLHRRRVLLAALLAATVASLVLACVARRAPVWGVQLTADALLVGYVGVLMHFRNAAAHREMTRRSLGG
jgi:hypothetical protein